MSSGFIAIQKNLQLYEITPAASLVAHPGVVDFLRHGRGGPDNYLPLPDTPA
jgi:hypothetical protein